MWNSEVFRYYCSLATVQGVSGDLQPPIPATHWWIQENIARFGFQTIQTGPSGSQAGQKCRSPPTQSDGSSAMGTGHYQDPGWPDCWGLWRARHFRRDVVLAGSNSALSIKNLYWENVSTDRNNHWYGQWLLQLRRKHHRISNHRHGRSLCLFTVSKTKSRLTYFWSLSCTVCLYLTLKTRHRRSHEKYQYLNELQGNPNLIQAAVWTTQSSESSRQLHFL